MVRAGLNRSEHSRHIEKMVNRAGTLSSETILRPSSNNFNVNVRVGVRFQKQLVCILYMIPYIS